MLAFADYQVRIRKLHLDDMNAVHPSAFDRVGAVAQITVAACHCLDTM